MKSGIKLGSFFFIILLTVLHLSCNNEDFITPGKNEISFKAYQLGGCNSHHLPKNAVQDSCFSYSFNDTLKIDFCVMGNCCPDSNRFVTDYKINSDTIFVNVADTAEKLCHCFCYYTIHLEMTGLTGNEYVLYCDSDSINVYEEKIAR